LFHYSVFTGKMQPLYGILEGRNGEMRWFL